jgi:protein SCO1/2
MTYADMNFIRSIGFLVWAIAVCAVSSALPGQYASATPEEALSAAARQYFTNVPLLTQHGESVRLYADLLKDKIVVINAFFGTCNGSCPKMAGVLAGLQDRLGDHLGKDVWFLSFSVDPETDTPEKLNEYANRFHAKPGWVFLTGQKDDLDFALFKLGQKVARREDHLTIFIVGNNKTGLWKKVFAPTSTPDSLKAVVESVLNDKG